MADPEPMSPDVPLSRLESQEKAVRAESFGAVAAHYERYRPGPSLRAVDWVLPKHVDTVVDLGAGTGALTRLLIDRAEEVIAVEPDDRMRAVLTEEVPGVRAVPGRGESVPIADGCVDAVLASSSWHWMEPVPTFREVGRILRSGGILGALWSGPDPEGSFMVQANAVLAERPLDGADAVAGDGAGESGGTGLAGATCVAPPQAWRFLLGSPSTSPSTRCSPGMSHSTPTS